MTQRGRQAEVIHLSDSFQRTLFLTRLRTAMDKMNLMNDTEKQFLTQMYRSWQDANIAGFEDLITITRKQANWLLQLSEKE